MRTNGLAFDGVRRCTVTIVDRVPLTAGPIFDQIGQLLATTRAAQDAVRAYKRTHPGEFQAQVAPRGNIPTINVPRRNKKA